MVPTIQEHKMVEEVMKLKKWLDNVAKSSVERRDPPPPMVKGLEEDLDKTFKVWQAMLPKICQYLTRDLRRLGLLDSLAMIS